MSFSLVEQELLRVRLRAYCAAHRIGFASRLSERIKRDTGINVTVKTLQRFVSGDRVNDLALTALARFLDKVEDRITVLGEALHRLQGTPCDKDISGEYTLLRGNHEYPVSIIKQGNFWRMTVREPDRRRIYEDPVIHTRACLSPC